ncbi:THUMP domain-containing protein [Balneolales bacterium ANBcel1]|nr:THUMP domain-containing protein [Balneolales bacterium ANBcel1]
MPDIESNQIQVFVKTLMGLEEVLADELRSLGAGDVYIGRRGVSCVADEETLYSILIRSRLALRVLIRLDERTVQSEQELYDWVKSIDWHDHLTLKHTLAVDVVTYHPEMNHSVFLAQKTKDAIVDRFREEYDLRPSVSPKDPDVRINLHISKDGTAHIGLDASGRSMNQRGYRKTTGKAAINEVLAAGLIAISMWDPETPFVDPMCGSGTLLIEAAMMAKNRAPALLNDSFGIKRWPRFREVLWNRLMRDAQRAERRDVDWIYGSDEDPRMIEISKKNIKTARLSRNIQLVDKPFQKLWIPEGNGVIISNPPYGEHIGERKQLKSMYEELGRVLRYKAKGYKAYFITPDPEFKKTMPLKHGKIFNVLNGTIPCEYISYSIGPKK